MKGGGNAKPTRRERKLQAENEALTAELAALKAQQRPVTKSAESASNHAASTGPVSCSPSRHVSDRLVWLCRAHYCLGPAATQPCPYRDS